MSQELHDRPIPILGTGACTPIGHSSLESWTSFRAGIVRFREIEESAEGSIRASYLATIPWGLSYCERTIELTRGALAELVRSLPLRQAKNLRAWIGIAESDRENNTAAEYALGEYLSTELPNLGTPPVFLRAGRSAFFAALEAAMTALRSHACDVALVGAVDSLCAPEPLRQLMHERRLLGPETEGVIPGEGAAFFLLARPGSALHARSRVHGMLLGCATAREARSLRQRLPNTGDALTSVLRTLRTHPVTRGRRADLFLTCETGEPFWSAELSMAYFRNTALMPEPFTRRMAAEGFGELGAAAGGVMAAIGVHWIARPAQGAPWRNSPPLLLVCGSSDGGDVGACLIEGNMTEGGR